SSTRRSVRAWPSRPSSSARTGSKGSAAGSPSPPREPELAGSLAPGSSSAGGAASSVGLLPQAAASSDRASSTARRCSNVRERAVTPRIDKLLLKSIDATPPRSPGVDRGISPWVTSAGRRLLGLPQHLLVALHPVIALGDQLLHVDRDGLELVQRTGLVLDAG